VSVLAYTGPTSVAPGASITLSATLTTGSGTAIAEQTVTFTLTLNGVTLTATTNGSGVASVVTTAPTTVGSYPITVAFAGNTTYAAAATSATLKVAFRGCRCG
jgi:Bacterial Ig-like domain (group 3)